MTLRPSQHRLPFLTGLQEAVRPRDLSMVVMTDSDEANPPVPSSSTMTIGSSYRAAPHGSARGLIFRAGCSVIPGISAKTRTGSTTAAAFTSVGRRPVAALLSACPITTRLFITVRRTMAFPITTRTTTANTSSSASGGTGPTTTAIDATTGTAAIRITGTAQTLFTSRAGM